MNDERYDFCPLQMINLWWSAWRMMWAWVGAEAGWRNELFLSRNCRYQYEWEEAERDRRFLNEKDAYWHKRYCI